MSPLPRYVGVDDWAIRKGHRYGTILIDLERGSVLDILPGRDGAALKPWLKEHSGVEVITRDRAAAYAQAAAEGAPQAKQVADRWHLLKKLREAVELVLVRLSATVGEALRDGSAPVEIPPTAQAVEVSGGHPSAVPQAAVTPGTSAPAAQEDAGTQAMSVPLSPRQQAQQTKRQLRAERYECVRQLRREGQSLRQIARAMVLSNCCMIRYLRAEHCPDWNPGRQRPTQLDEHTARIEEWLTRDGRNAADLYRDLRAEGGRGVDLVFDATYSEQGFVQTAQTVRRGGSWIVHGVGPGKTTRLVETHSPVDAMLAERGAKQVNVNLHRYFSEPAALDGEVQAFLQRGMALAMERATQGPVVPQVNQTIDSTVAAINSGLQSLKAGRGIVGKVAAIVDRDLAGK